MSASDREAAQGDATLAEQLDAVCADAERLAASAGEAAGRVARLAGERVRERPYTVLGTAFAAGFVLARGLPPTAVSLLSALAGRAALRAAAPLAVGLARAGADGAGDASEEEPGGPRAL